MSGSQKPVLMTRREYVDPLGSDEEDEEKEPKKINSAPVTPAHRVCFILN